MYNATSISDKGLQKRPILYNTKDEVATNVSTITLKRINHYNSKEDKPSLLNPGPRFSKYQPIKIIGCAHALALSPISLNLSIVNLYFLSHAHVHRPTDEVTILNAYAQD